MMEKYTDSIQYWRTQDALERARGVEATKQAALAWSIAWILALMWAGALACL